MNTLTKAKVEDVKIGDLIRLRGMSDVYFTFKVDQILTHVPDALCGIYYDVEGDLVARETLDGRDLGCWRDERMAISEPLGMSVEVAA